MMELMESMMRLPFCTCLVPSFRIIPGFTVLIRVPDGSSMPNNASLRSPPTVQGGSPLAREVNRLCSFYEKIDVHAYEETRSLVSSPAHPDSTRTEHFTQYPYWVGRRYKRGQPICMFDAAKLGSKTMAAFKKSSAKLEVKRSDLKMPGIVSTEMLRAFTKINTLTRFVMPLCSAVPSRKYLDIAVTKMLCVVDISGMGLRQFWNLRGYLQNLSRLVGINYPEILDHVLVRFSPASLHFQSVTTITKSLNGMYQVIGAPSYFPIVWSWIKK